MGKSKKGYYAVQNGRQTGVFTSWAECEAQVRGYPGGVFKSFDTAAQAEAFAASSTGYSSSAPKRGAPAGSDYKAARPAQPVKTSTAARSKTQPALAPVPALHVASRLQTQDSSEVCAAARAQTQSADKIFPSTRQNKIIVYCDGSSIGNGTKGARAGWGVYFEDPNLKHLNESCRLPGPIQTNNRAELTALIRAIQLVPREGDHANSQLVLMTDSRYSLDCVDKWITGWKARGWKLLSGKDVLNRDLIEQLDAELNNRHPRPILEKVKAHSGIEGNEIVDRMAKLGASMP